MKNYASVLENIKNSDKKYIIGVDECGTGSLIGDAWVVAFLSEKDWQYSGLDDSKKLTAKKRQNIYNEMFRQNGQVQFTSAAPKQKDIEELGLSIALKNGYKQAIDLLLFESDLTTDDYIIVIDGIHKVEGLDHYSLPKADSLIQQVSAASVLGKVARDSYVSELAKLHPQYGWDKNFGYATSKHLDAIKLYGYTEFHRKNYEPVKSML